MKIAAMVGGGVVAVVLGSLLAATLSGCAGSAPVLASAFEDGWETVPLLEPRMSLCSVELAGGRVLLLGGSRLRDPVVLDSTEVYDPVARRIGAGPRMLHPRQWSDVALLPDGTVFVLGDSHASAELLVPGRHGFTPTKEGFPRHSPTLVELLDGRVLVLGGGGHGGHSRTDLYDPASGEFTRGPDLIDARLGVVATRLLDGRVLVTGGISAAEETYNEHLSSAEIYDPASGAFSPTGRMRGSGIRTATLLDDGRVLIVGGLGSVHRAAELYDPATGTFHESAELDWPRIQHVAVRLTDGRVLVAGGTGDDHRGRSTILDRVEIFDPRSETFLPAAPLNEARSSATAVALPGGAAIVAGGWTGVGASGTAEVYDPDRRD